ncbi:U32 family peptidase [Candidatus Falkowbacteria bacterium]|jgi:putative protease|nr:U32 family peptidase [Candidatus Falkowbacteria bacterium]
MNNLELLAPAGNFLKMKTAFTYGADAVYLGIPDFSLRVRINDFDLQGIKEAVKYAHDRQKKVYVTVNIFAHNQHLSKLPAYIKVLKALKVDALIISDPGILALVKKYWPKAEIHLSTQANCTNLAAVKFWQKQGVKRIILGREVTLKEIKEIHQAAPQVDLEYFVHGAMCMTYSGRCFLSKLLVDRSANLGDCAQPCRWEYDVLLRSANHPEELEIVEERHGAYLLNSKDLCLLKYLKELAAAGVTSFKIEGRAKSVYYQAVVCGIYRQALELITKKTPATKLNQELDFLEKELKTKLVHRGYTTGFLLGDKADQNIFDSHNVSSWEFCGQVINLEERQGKKLRIYFQVHNTLKIGDKVEIIKPNYDIIKIKLENLWEAKTEQALTKAHGGGGGTIAYLEYDFDAIPNGLGTLPVLSVLRRLNQR